MKEETLKVKLLKAGLPNETIFVLGSHGSGKTTLIANLVQDKKRFIIFDTKQDFDPAFFPGSVVCQDASGLLALLNKGNDKIIVQLFNSLDQETTFSQCCDVVFRWYNHNQKTGITTWFVLDELNAFCSTHECSSAFQNILQRGRSVGIKKMFGAQWFGTIPTWVRDGFSEIYCFRHTDESGLERLSQYGFSIEEIQDLPQYTCLYSGKNKHARLSLVLDKQAKQQTTNTEKGKQ